MTSVVGAPAFVLGLLVPIRESGSLVPQLFIGSAVQRLAIAGAGSLVLGGGVALASTTAHSGIIAVFAAMALGGALLALALPASADNKD